jgi:hypothetical protein
VERGLRGQVSRGGAPAQSGWAGATSIGGQIDAATSSRGRYSDGSSHWRGSYATPNGKSAWVRVPPDQLAPCRTFD